ncbi:MAG: TetR/AcrR family transcriptional regulator [Myxococcaceae bacterium]
MQRTLRTLREALIELMLERGWEDTSVQHVCDRADVGRSTFYTHFADKEDLLISGFEELRMALREQQAASASTRALGFARGLIEHAHEHRRLFRAIVGKRSGQVVQQRFRQLLVDLVHEELAALAPAGPRLDGTVHYVAGALFELLMWWLDARNPLPPADLEQLFHRLTTPVLAASRESDRPRRQP